jgi:formate dehydrogenase maturation protein FdhE
MSTAAWSTGSIWDKRIERAESKEEDSPWARELLGFYRRILEFQKTAFERELPAKATGLAELRSLRESLDLYAAASSMPSLLETVERWAPEKLQQEAKRLGSLPAEQIHDRLQNCIQLSPADGSPPDFFSRAVLQPLAERIARNTRAENSAVTSNQCPRCGGVPQLAVLRQEGDGGKRWLLCSFCQTEWDFHRVRCPKCGERDHEKLPRFTSEDHPAVRVEACDSCHTYLKSFDLTVDGTIVPLVDEIATAPLDIWAAEKGYRKLQPNLLGF